MSGAMSAASTPTPSLARASGFAQQAPTAAAHSSKPARPVGLGGPGCANQQPNSSQTAATSSSKNSTRSRVGAWTRTRLWPNLPLSIHCPVPPSAVIGATRGLAACWRSSLTPSTPVSPLRLCRPITLGQLRRRALLVCFVRVRRLLWFLSCSARLPSPDLPCPPSPA